MSQMSYFLKNNYSDDTSDNSFITRDWRLQEFKRCDLVFLRRISDGAGFLVEEGSLCHQAGINFLFKRGYVVNVTL